MSKTPRDQKPKRVLSDHKQIGKRFIPPFVHTLGKLQEVKWVDAPLPELFWLALLNHHHGLRRGAELAVATAKSGIEALAPSKKIWFGPISTFSQMNELQQMSFLESMRNQRNLEDMLLALSGLVELYPECPLAFIFEGKVPQGERSDHLIEMKTLLTDLLDRSSRAATLMQANAIYIAFALDMLRVSSETPFSNFEEVANYPHTGESKIIAASVRAMVTGLFGKFGALYDFNSQWPRYFWNRGLEIDPCSFGADTKDE